MRMETLFINPDSSSLRAGWRILVFVGIFFAITAITMVSVRTVLGGLRRASGLQFTLLALSATLAVFLARKYFDKKTLKSLGLQWGRLAILDVVSGVVIAALVMAGVYLILWGASLIEFHGFTWWQEEADLGTGFQLAALPVVLAVLFKLTAVAWWEELVFRGYLLQNLIAGIGLRLSVVLTSLVFGLGHYFNPDATVLSTLLIALITPLLIYAYLASGQLWLPMGLHLGWNFFQAAIFGFAASGQPSPSLISQSPTGPDWLSGGPFGAEGSLLILPFTILSFVLVHYWVGRTRQSGQKARQAQG